MAVRLPRGAHRKIRVLLLCCFLITTSSNLLFNVKKICDGWHFKKHNRNRNNRNDEIYDLLLTSVTISQIKYAVWKISNINFCRLSCSWRIWKGSGNILNRTTLLWKNVSFYNAHSASILSTIHLSSRALSWSRLQWIRLEVGIYPE